MDLSLKGMSERPSSYCALTNVKGNYQLTFYSFFILISDAHLIQTRILEYKIYQWIEIAVFSLYKESKQKQKNEGFVLPILTG